MVFDKDEVLKQMISSLCTYPMMKMLCSLVFYLPGGFTNSLNVVCTPQLPPRDIHIPTALHMASHSLDWEQNSGTGMGAPRVKPWGNSFIFQGGNVSGTAHRAATTSWALPLQKDHFLWFSCEGGAENKPLAWFLAEPC